MQIMVCLFKIKRGNEKKLEKLLKCKAFMKWVEWTLLFSAVRYVAMQSVNSSLEESSTVCGLRRR